MIKMIAAVSQNGVIGVDNYLPFNYPADMKHFRRQTANSTVIMGRNTFASIGYPLPKRTNIVVTSKNISNQEVLTTSSLQQAISISPPDKDIFLIGGFSIYVEGMNFAKQIILTLTPDIVSHKLVTRFPWINPAIFKLTSLEPMSTDPQLQVAIYNKLDSL